MKMTLVATFLMILAGLVAPFASGLLPPETPAPDNSMTGENSTSSVRLFAADLAARLDLSGLPPRQELRRAPARVDTFAALSGWQLTGIIQADGEPIITLQRGTEYRQMRIDDTLDGLVLARVEGRTATFAAGEETREIGLPPA